MDANVCINRGIGIYLDYLSNTNISIGKNVIMALSDISIEQNSWIGANPIILPGVTIWKNFVIGAGSIIRNSTPSNSIVANNNKLTVLNRKID